METITSDIIIEIQTEQPYVANNSNPQKGKEIRPLMESLGWEFVGEISKTINGQETTVAKYQR